MSVKLRYGLWSVALAGIFTLIAVTLIAFSFDMDEFLPYHPIACDQVQQAVSTFQGACNVLPTQFLGWEYQRSFNYAGAVSGWMMTPVFALWHSWWAHAVFGLFTLLIAGWGIVRSLQLAPRFILVTFAFLPLLLPTVHDTGPIRLALVVIAWTPAALRFQFSSRPVLMKVLVGCTLALGWIASTENKPYFLFLVPGTVIWSIACLNVTMGTGFVRSHFRALLLWFFGLTIPCIVLLFVLRIEGMSYFAYLRHFPSPNDPLVNVGTGLSFLGDWALSAQRFLLLYPNVDASFPKLLQSPLNSLPLSADRGAPLSLLLTLGTIALTVTLISWAIRRCWTQISKSTTLLLFGAVLLFFAGAWISGGGSVHHFVFAQIGVLSFILLSFNTTAYGALRAATSIVAISWLAMLSILSSGRNPAVGSNVEEIMTIAQSQASDKVLINCASWGCYHQFAFLENKPAPIVFAESVSDQLLLLGKAKGSGKSVVHVCRDCTIEQLEKNLNPRRIDEIGSSPGGWHAFSIEP